VYGDAGRNERLQRFYAKKKVYNFRQKDGMNIGEYRAMFEILVKAAEKSGAIFYEQEDIIDTIKESNQQTGGSETWESLRKERQAVVKVEARDRALGTIFSENSNQSKFAVYK